ncbi:hypothetical protein H0H93_010513, partial [Arthromyces matolae]
HDQDQEDIDWDAEAGAVYQGDYDDDHGPDDGKTMMAVDEDEEMDELQPNDEDVVMEDGLLDRFENQIKATSPLPPTPHTPPTDPNPAQTLPPPMLDPSLVFPDTEPLPAGHAPITVVIVDNITRGSPMYPLDVGLQWLQSYLPTAVYERIKAVWPNQIYLHESYTPEERAEPPHPTQAPAAYLKWERTTMVLIEEQTLFVAFLMMRVDDFDVTLMPFHQFKKEIISGNHSPPLLQAQLILGSADTTVDFLEPACPFGFTPTTFYKYWVRITKLAETKVVYPNPTESLYAGSKVFYIQEYAKISKSSPFEIPVMFVFKPVKNQTLHPNVVYKRSFSDCSKGVFVATDAEQHQAILTKMLEQNKAMQATYGKLKSKLPLACCWWAMPFNPLLKYVGELRVEIMGGVIVSVTETRVSPGPPQLIAVHEVRHVTPLDMIKYPEPTNLGDPDVNIRLLKRSHAIFERYVYQLFWDIIQVREKQFPGVRSELRSFARFDIAVWKGPDGLYHYVLNEIEMGVTSMLFWCDRTDNEILSEARTMGDVLLTKVLRRERGQIV